MAPKYSGNISTDEADLLSAPINISSSGLNTIVAGSSGSMINVYRLILIAAANNTITFFDGTTPLSGPVFLAADQSLFFRFDTKPWFDTISGNDFVINLKSSQQVGGVLYYTMSTTGAVAVPPPTPVNGYITEDATKFYVTEDGVTFYVQES